METPMGTSPGTRALTRNNTKLLERQHKVEMECNNLKRDIEIWIKLMSASPAPELSVVLDGYERFKRGIQRTSQEAILKRLPSHYTFILSGLQVNILRIRKKAWQRDKNDLNKPSRPSANLSECSGDEDGVFEPNVRTNSLNDEFLDNMDDDLHICDPPLNNENELNKSKLSESIEEIRSVVRNASTISPSLSETNTRILAIETSIKSISSICSDINDRLSIVIQNSTMNFSAIESLDCRVNQLDKDLKTYVDSQFKGVNERIDRIPPPRMDNQPLNVQTSSIEMLRREVKSIKSEQKRDELTISYISDTIADVKDQLDQSLDKSVDGGLGTDKSHDLTPPSLKLPQYIQK